MSDLGAHVGTSYTGETHNTRMEGKGEYTFADGVVYKGEFHDGMFHGKGVLHYPNGGEYASTWCEGKETQGGYEFHDGLKFGGTGWDYVTPSDRRFFTERKGGIKPSGDTALRDRPDKPEVPPACFDLGNDMYLDAAAGQVCRTSTREVLRSASAKETVWATAKARQNTAGTGPDVAARAEQVHDHFAPVPGHGAASGKVHPVFLPQPTGPLSAAVGGGGM